MKRYTVTIWTTLLCEGFHRWPDAPERYAHLRDRHRHLFHLRAAVDVTKTDRELSFEELRECLADSWAGPELGTSSCEEVALHIAQQMADKLARRVDVTCSEDGESGASATGFPL